MSERPPPEPWFSFLGELDQQLGIEPEFSGIRLDLHSFGGFVVSMLYDLQRATADLDVIGVYPLSLLRPLLNIAGAGTPLARKHGVYIDAQGRVGTPAEGYEGRLIEMFPGTFRNLRLFAPDAYDLALSKLERNADRDMEDVKLLALNAPLDPQVLRERYDRTLRPYLLGRTEWHDETLQLWVEMIQEVRGSPRTGTD